jgi:ribosomal protein L15
LYRRLPKFQGGPQKGHTKTVYELIKLHMLNVMPENSEVDAATLLEMGVLTKPNKGRKLYKVVGGVGPLEVSNLTVRAHAFTASTRAAIEQAGGACVLMSPTRPIPLAVAEAEKRLLKEANLIKLKARRKLKEERNSVRLL